MIEITDVRSLGDRIGQEIAVGDWVEITQARIDLFAEATGDAQWIHVDPARASVESPFKTTIAHGFLTLSLLSALIRDAMTFHGLRMAINYGMNRLRFVGPVPAGSRIRARFTPAAVEDASSSVQVTWHVTIECEHAAKPCCVAEWIVRYYPA
jgi:acyl dehydratase